MLSLGYMGSLLDQSVISIGNSTVYRGIWDKYREWYFKIHQNITSRRGGEWYLGSFEISQAGIYSKYPEETVLSPAYTTRQRNFALYVTGVIFTCKYYKYGLNTTGLSQSHFRNLWSCSITFSIAAQQIKDVINHCGGGHTSLISASFFRFTYVCQLLLGLLQICD